MAEPVGGSPALGEPVPADPPESVDVLLVEPNPLEIELTLRPLAQAGADLRIGIARDGEEALDYLLARGRFRHRASVPAPRLILVNLRLPRVDGLELVRALRASGRRGSCPVVMLVPEGDPEELAQCYHAGANSCVVKPMDFSSFHEVIRAVVRYWLEVNADGQRARGPVGQRARGSGRIDRLIG